QGHWPGDRESNQSTQQTNACRLDQELDQDVPPLGTNRFANPNLTRALRYRNEHDVHDPNPTYKERKPGYENAHRRNRSTNTMKHFHELILLVDGKVVRLVRWHAADLAHGTPQLLFGLFKLSEVLGFDLDRVIRPIPNFGRELRQRDNHLVI